MRGKYSPTVSWAYAKDQEWWNKYSNQCNETYNQYDPDGYDSYGYNEDNVDRAGNHEHVYYSDNASGENSEYNDAHSDWVFDGVKPIHRSLKELKHVIIEGNVLKAVHDPHIFQFLDEATNIVTISKMKNAIIRWNGVEVNIHPGSLVLDIQDKLHYKRIAQIAIMEE